MLGDFNAFCASFLNLGDVIAAGALAIPQFYAATGVGLSTMKVQRHHHFADTLQRELPEELRTIPSSSQIAS